MTWATRLMRVRMLGHTVPMTTATDDEYLNADDAADRFGVRATSVRYLGQVGRVRVTDGVRGRGRLPVKGYHLDDLTAHYARETGALTVSASPCVYVVLPDPDTRPTRVKVGATDSLDVRLSAFRTVCPDVQVLTSYLVPRSCEGYALSLARSLCTRSFPASPEVFDFTDESLSNFLDTLDNAFSSLTVTDDLDEPTDES